MSDGPYRSLPMTKKWRDAAKRADGAAFSPEDIADAFKSALVEECNAEIPVEVIPAIQNIFGDDRNLALFPENKGDQFDAVAARDAAGYPLAMALIDCAKDVAAEGIQGPAAMREAVARLLHERALRAERQIVEHYHRESTMQRTINIRHRIDSAIRLLKPLDMAAQLLGRKSTRFTHVTQKQNNLDDGPPL